MANFKELYGRSRLDRVGDEEYRGVRVFQCAHSHLVALANSLYHSHWPGKSGDSAPQCYRTSEITGQGDERKDWGHLYAYYQTPKQVVGKAQLSMGGSYTLRIPDNNPKDKDGYIINGPDPDGLHYWRAEVDAGPYPIIQLETADTKMNINAAIGYVGTTNESAYDYIFGADADTLLMLPFAVSHEHEAEFVFINYQMAYNKDGWANAVKTEKGIWVINSRPLFTHNPRTDVYTDSGAVRTVQQFLAGARLSQDADGTWKIQKDAWVGVPLRMWDLVDWPKLAGKTTW